MKSITFLEKVNLLKKKKTYNKHKTIIANKIDIKIIVLVSVVSKSSIVIKKKTRNYSLKCCTKNLPNEIILKKKTTFKTSCNYICIYI